MRRISGLRWVVVAGVWLLLIVPLGVWLLRGLVAQVPAVALQVEEHFNYGIVSKDADVTLGGFQATPRGFSLPPQQRGEIEYRIRTARPLTRWSALTFQWYGGEPGIRSTVDLRGPDGPEPLVQDRSLVGARLSLPAYMAGRTDIALRFSAWNATDRERLLLDKLVIQAWEGPPPSWPSPLWVVGACLALTLGLAAITVHPRRTLLVGLLLTLAAVLRYVNLLRVALAPLDPDAQGYRAYARVLAWIGPHGFYSASFGEREPLYPAVVRLALRFLGDSDLSLRLLTLILSIGVVYLGFRLGKAILGFGGGLSVGLLLAVSVPAIIESGRGLRVELETLLFTGLVWLILAGRGSLTWDRALLSGVLGGGLLLIRFPYAPALVLVFALSAWWHRSRDRRVWRPILVAATIGLVLVLPHRVALALRHGDAGYDVVRTLRWIANQEFQGQPGFPSPATLIQDPYAGPRITLGQYYFGLHAPWEVFWRSLRGLGKAVLSLSVVGYVEQVRAVVGLPLGWVDLLAGALGVIGLGVLACRPDAGWVPLALVLGLAHVAFVYDLGLPDYRFRMILQGMPLFAVSVVAGGRWSTARILTMFRAIRARWAIGTRPSTPASTGKGS